MMDSMLAAVHVVYPGAKDTGRNKVAKMRLSLRLDSKARGWRILCCHMCPVRNIGRELTSMAVANTPGFIGCVESTTCLLRRKILLTDQA